MTVVIDGTTGISGVDGTAASPAFEGNDTNTGIFFPAADTVAVTTGGTERMRVDSGGVITSGLGGMQVISDTAKSATGTSVDFTGIPSWVKRITVMFNGVSTSGTSNLLIQIGAGSVTTSGYVSTAYTSVGAASSTAGFIATQAITAATSQTGLATIVTLGSNLWIAASSLGFSNTSIGNTGNGNITLGGTLDRVRITTVNGTDTFDAGTINILYE